MVTALLYLVVASVLAYAALWLFPKKSLSKIVWGTTYSAPYAAELGLDPRETYLAILNELKPKRLRLVSYWNRNQPTPDTWDFSDLDFEIAEAEKRRIPYVVAIGRRVPRWPECFSPDWTKELPESVQQEKLYAYLKVVISRYDKNQYLFAWQVENEPNLRGFSDCPKFSGKYLPDEVALVRSLSQKPVMITSSGEAYPLGLGLARHANLFAMSLYRTVLHNGRFVTKRLPPGFYALRAFINRLHPRVKRVIISELQTEPWVEQRMVDRDQDYYDLTMSIQKFKAAIDFAQRTRLPEVYFWGAEWWYYELKHGQRSYWDTAKSVFEASA